MLYYIKIFKHLWFLSRRDYNGVFIGKAAEATFVFAKMRKIRLADTTIAK